MTEEQEKRYINSIEEFDEWFRGLHEQNMIYRGLKDSRWYLSASAYHHIGNEENNDLPNPMPGFIKVVKRLIEDAKMEGHHEKDGRQMKDLPLLAELQHNGAATCLIDFTKNPYVALWFACQPITKEQSNKKLHGEPYVGSKIVALNTTISENLEKFTRIRPEHLEKDIDAFLGKEQLWIWSPSKQNQRIIAQQSIFILGKEIIEDKEVDKICFVAEKAKKYILQELKKQGISEDSLFCDFVGFAQQNAWDKPYQNLISLTSDDYLQRAIYAYQSNDLEKAIEYCNKAIEIAPQYERAYYIRGSIKGGSRDYDGAIPDFDKTIEINPKHDDAHYRRGIAKWEKSNYDGAITDFDMAIQLNPQHDDTYYHRGVAKRMKNDHDGAITDFDIAIQLNPQHDNAYHHRGIIKGMKDDHDGAIADFDIAIQLNPQHNNAYRNRSVAKIKKDDYDGAIADLDIAIQLNPQHDDAYHHRAVIKEMKDNHDEAIPDFDMAIQLNPQHDDAYHNRGVAKGKKGDYDGAIADFDMAIQLNPLHDDAYHNRSVAKGKKAITMVLLPILI